ncbi:GNAT family N-acetyltransferase [uncultured Moraxella sp.]|uniref:GNAT family N-acetyltransferase n=1 Tax=uncultured Moraxella sp. TaxID=263769 RepID=UPI0025D2A137|nr:GNAT family N-acetyltransferase [uncultured Moraxella sp.]
MAIAQQIRLARRADLPRLVEIFNETVDDKIAHASLTPHTVDGRMAWFEAHNDATRPIYVVVDDGQIVAWASFSDLYSLPAYHITAEISLYITKPYHHRGMGKSLLAFMLSVAPKHGIDNVVALIFQHNLPSLSLFAQFDFVQWGVLPKVCDMDGFLADTVIMGRRLLP